MELFTRPAAVIPAYPLRNLGDPDRFLFLDIETTGLSPASAQIYLIGALTHTEPMGWVLRQWFADSLSAEEEMLRSFFEFAAPYRTLVHYNGDSFDIPFLIRCAGQYGIERPFGGASSLDLYRAVRPFRKVLGSGRLNQKSMERLLGIERMDRMNGGELIEVYNTWLRTRETALKQQFLLHNEEDVTNLLTLLSLLSYRDFFLGDFTLKSASAENAALTARFESRTRIPAASGGTFGGVRLDAEENTLQLIVPLFTGTLFHFFENYRDYYYLPLENRAIHKSLAEFVDKSAKERATARNACVPKEGTFLPLAGSAPEGVPVFQAEFRGAVKYAELSGDLLTARFLLPYLYEVLRLAGLRGQLP